MSVTNSSCIRHYKVQDKTVTNQESKGATSHVELKQQHNFSHVYFHMHLNGFKNMHSQLSYVGQECWKIPQVLVKLYGGKVHFLDLSYNCLTTLQGVEKFVNLQELVLDNNNLSDTVTIPQLPSLQILSLNKNNFSNLETLLNKVAHNFPSLHYLSLLGNIACPNQLSDVEKDEEDYQRYRYYVLHHLPRLKFLDSRPVTLTERKEAQHRGKFMKIVRPISYKNDKDDDHKNSPPSNYTPLPSSRRGIGDHQGAYGKCRYRYSGKHSEGNRFIQNSDL